MARAAGGRFLLRIEDIDRQRSRPEWEAAILDDLDWLGIRWDAPPLRQSTRLDAYARRLRELWDADLLFACDCSRADVRNALGAPQEGVPANGPDGPVYPGTCRGRRRSTALPRPPAGMALRLDMAAAVEAAGALVYDETGTVSPSGRIRIDPAALVRGTGDVVLARKDMGTSYHLSVTLDDAAQDVSHVIRGADLAPATPIHVLLQRLLGLPTPVYHHHRLIRDEAGKRLAKRDDARAIARYREDGMTPQDIRRLVGLA